MSQGFIFWIALPLEENSFCLNPSPDFHLQPRPFFRT